MSAQLTSLDQAVERIRLLSARGRTLVGVCGAPGSGKSYFATRLQQALGEDCALVSMDGFHLSNEFLIDRGIRDRKGAWDTFDVLGYVSLLQRLRDNRDQLVFAPRFDRELEESIASAVPIPRSKRIILTDGNYLLLERGDWWRVAPLLDEVWFRDVDEDTRVERLVQRRLETTDEDRETAMRWVTSVDVPNGWVVEETIGRSDAVIRVELD